MVLNEAVKMGGVPEGYAEVVIDFFQFKNEGDHISGRLVSKLTTVVRGNKIGKYTIITPENRRVSFLGGVDLDEKMNNVGIGNEIYVQYTHKEQTSSEGFEMKRFKVFVKASQ